MSAVPSPTLPSDVPQRRCLPLELWPSSDRRLFEVAISPGGLLDEAGAAMGWAEPTRRSRVKLYGRWIGDLLHHDPCALDAPPDDRVTPERLAAFIVRLQQQGLSSRTVWSYLLGVYAVLRVMFPTHDWHWIRPEINRLGRAVIPARPIEPDLVPPWRLFRAGCRLMDTAERNEAGLTPIRRAVQFRDGLLLALQTSLALRLKNLSSTGWRQHLLPTADGGFRIAFAREKMKNRRPFGAPLPDRLVPYMRRYLAHHRPILLQGREHSGFWVSQYGEPLSYDGVNRRLAIITRRAVGKTLRSHRFRHCLASGVIDALPEHARMVPAQLQQATWAAAEIYYIRGRSVIASRRQNAAVAERRRRFRAEQTADAATAKARRKR